MSMDFTVIQPVRQRFGAGPGAAPAGENAVFSNAPFVGPSKSFSFACPSVDTHQMGVLQFETVGVDLDYSGDAFDFPESIIRINGVDLPGGIKPGETGRRIDSNFYPTWRTQILIVPERVLGEQNVLYIEAAETLFGGHSWRDAFVIDNVVILFKTARRDPGKIGDPRLDPTPE